MAFADVLKDIADGKSLASWLLELDALPTAPPSSENFGFGEMGFGEFGFGEDGPGDAGGLEALYYSSHGFTSRSTDVPASTHYDGRVTSSQVARRIVDRREGFGGITRVLAEVFLQNGDGGLDTLAADYALDGRSCRIMLGRNGDPRTDYGVVFDGFLVTAPEVSNTHMRFSLTDAAQRLDLPINKNTYAGTGALEGGTDLKGKPKPKAYGHAFNVSPPLVDSVKLIYQVHDGAISDVPFVWDRQVPITKGSDYATVDDLNNIAPAGGTYRVFKGGGYFRLGSTPAGTVTCDVHGDASGSGYVNKTGDIVRRILVDQAAFSSAPSGALEYDFSRATIAPQVGTATITFTRSGATATRVNSSGVIETVAADTPRFDHDPVTLRCIGLLHEPTITNGWLRNAEFDNASWSKVGCTVTANAVIGGDGTMSADALVEDGTTGTHSLMQGASYTNGVRHTISVYAKPGIRSRMQLFFSSVYASPGGAVGVFDVANGSVVSVSGDGSPTAYVEPGPLGYYRFVLSAICTGATQSHNAFIFADNGTTNNYTGSNGSTALYLWGAQTEPGPEATSVIMTAGSTVTRNIDTPVISTIPFYNAAEGALAVRARLNGNGDTSTSRGLFEFWNGTDNTESVAFLIDNGGSGGTLRVYDGAALLASVTPITTQPAKRTPFNLVGSWKLNDVNAARDGTVHPTGDTSVTMPSPDRVRIGNYVGVSTRGHIERIRYFPRWLEALEIKAESVELGSVKYADVDDASFTQLNTDAPAEVGIWIGTEVRSMADVIDQLLAGVGAYGGFSRLGTFTVGVIKTPADALPVAEFDQSDIIELEREPLPSSVDPVIWRARVAWQHNYTLQTDVAGGVTADRRSFAAQADRIAPREDSTIVARRVLAKEYGPTDNLYAVEADADTEALRLFNLWSVPRGLYGVQLPPTAMVRDLNEALGITHPRHGFADGKTVRVLGHEFRDTRVFLKVLA